MDLTSGRKLTITQVKFIGRACNSSWITLTGKKMKQEKQKPRLRNVNKWESRDREYMTKAKADEQKQHMTLPLTKNIGCCWGMSHNSFTTERNQSSS